MAAFPEMHGDPLLSRPLSTWSARDWDEVAHLSDLAADVARDRSVEDAYRVLPGAAEFRRRTAETPVRSTT